MGSLAILDLDGTLVDTPRAIVESFRATFAAIRTSAPDDNAIRTTIGLPLEKAFSQLMNVNLDDDLVARGIAQYQVYFKEIILPRAAALVFPGVPDGLSKLLADGLTLAVATSKFRSSAEALLEAAGIRDPFALIVGADQVTHPKPHPESAQLILRNLRVPPQRAIMVGDTAHDIRMARSAGIRSIAVTYGVHSLPDLLCEGPTWIAHTFDDVVTHLTAACSSPSEETQE
jgi:phosphoglycolate phosphatase